MRGLFTTVNGGFDLGRVRGNFDKIAIQYGSAFDLDAVREQTDAVVALWDAEPGVGHTEDMIQQNPDEVILQAEGEADPVIDTVLSLRRSGFKRLLSIVTNLNPSRTDVEFDSVMHAHSVRMLVECYLPDNPALTVPNMLAEAHWRGYPHAEPVLGCYATFGLKDYQPLPARYWVWEAAQMPDSDWARP